MRLQRFQLLLFVLFIAACFGSISGQQPLAIPAVSGNAAPAAGTIVTYAGNGFGAGTGNGGYSGDGGPATSAELYSPYGVTFDAAGNLYIADTDNNRIRKVTAATGAITTIAGNGLLYPCPGSTTPQNYCGNGGPATSATLTFPQAAVFDSAGNLYIAETDALVRKVDASTGMIGTYAGKVTCTSGFLGTSCLPSNGYAGDGGPATSAELAFPVSLAIDASNNLYIADGTANVVRVVSASSGIITTFAGGGSGCGQQTDTMGDGCPATQAQFGGVKAIALDKTGNLYVADYTNNVSFIRKVDAKSGIITLFAGGGTPCSQATDGYGDGCPALNATLELASGMAFDASGNLYVGDDGLVRKISASTMIVTDFAGGAGIGFTGTGGPAQNAKVDGVSGMAVDPSGNVYLADTFNNVIREVIENTTPVTPVPTFSPAGGTYSSEQMVSISDSLSTATIYYTTDGSTPTTSSTEYTGAIAVSQTTTINSIAIASGYTNSALATATYAIQQGVATPTVTVTPSSLSITTAQSDQVMVTVSGGNGNPTPTGSVVLSSGTYNSGATTLTAGSATINIPAGKLSVGNDTLTASYTPDAGSSSIYSSAIGSAPLTVVQAIGTCTTPNLNPNPNPAAFSSQGDFNGDCKSDILWRNTSTGETDIWLMNGTGITSGADLGTIATAWTIAGAGDFNGDGKSDMLWRNTSTGEVNVWLMNGTGITNASSLGTIATNWTIAAVGDFNGDGKSDILWRNTSTGEVNMWIMNGTGITSAASLGTIATNWSIVGTGDFNGDGKADILWRNSTTGEVNVWLMNGTAITGAVNLGTIATNWSISGIGDFNGNGKSDILWRNTSTGELDMWLMNGTSIAGASNLGTIATAWAIAGTGDLNGDGKADILWRNTSTGEVDVWLMNGTGITSASSLGTIATNWQIATLSP